MTSSAGFATKAAGTIWKCLANASSGRSSISETARPGSSTLAIYLFEERFNRAALDQLSWDLGEGPYNAQILQRPSPPGGLLFKLKHFQRYETPPKYYE